MAFALGPISRRFHSPAATTTRKGKSAEAHRNGPEGVNVMARELAGIFPSRCKSEKKNPPRGCRQEYRVKLKDELTTAVELRAGDVTGWKRGRKGKAAIEHGSSCRQARIYGDRILCWMKANVCD